MRVEKIVVAGSLLGALSSWQQPANAMDCSRQFFLYGSDYVTLGDRSTVGSGSVGAGQRAELGANARIQGSLLADSITLRSNSLLKGAAYTNHAVSLQAGARILGQTLPIPSGLLCTAPVIPSVQPGGPDVYVEDTVQLPPGHYGHLYVTPDSTLIVSDGDYHFEAVVFEPDSKLVGMWHGEPARLLASDGVMFGDRHQQSLSQPGSNANSRAGIIIYSLQTDQLRVGTDSTIYAQIIAPFAEVNVPPRARVHAPLYGKTVRVEPDSSIGGPVSGQPNACR